MGCSSCSSGNNGTPGGCGNKGHCASGGCNKMNTFDWLSFMELPEAAEIDIVEITFKNGVRKEFFRRPSFIDVVTGDMVAVESAGGGYDIGRISLSGELVRLQMKKRRVKSNAIFPNVLRLANERDLERLQEARDMERDTMIKARAIVAQLNLDMKVGEVEVQGDKRKATFYYTAEGRVDFRELIRIYAREFKVKIEMRQIGARQESAIIGGLGPCGRELCCSTWLTDFKSVSTGAARYQNLAINQSKLSGQCGRLKCCLNFELNTYLDALREFPKNVENLDTLKGSAFLLKTDIFKRIMFFAYRKDYGGLEVFPLSIERVKEIAEMNRKGKKPADLLDAEGERAAKAKKEIKSDEFIDGAGSLELSHLEDKKKRNNNNNKKRRNNNKKPQGEQQQGTGQGQTGPGKGEPKNTPRPEHKTGKPEHKTGKPEHKLEPKQEPKQGQGGEENNNNNQKGGQGGQGGQGNNGNKQHPQHQKPRHKKPFQKGGEKKEGQPEKKEPPTGEKKDNAGQNTQPKITGEGGNANKEGGPQQKKHRNHKRKFNQNKKGGGPPSNNNEKKDN